MNHFLINDLPENLQSLIAPLLGNISTRSVALQIFSREARATGAQENSPVWSAYELKLMNAWKGYTALRFYLHLAPSYTSSRTAQGLLMLKKSKGYDIVLIERAQKAVFKDAFEELATYRRLTCEESSRKIIDKSRWDGLSIYTENANVQQYYDVQNLGAAQCLLEKIKKNTSSGPVTVVDLGCGTGNIFKRFLQLSAHQAPLPQVQWQGTDYSQKNIDEARQAFAEQTDSTTWTQAHALDFVKNLNNTIPDLYVIASGLLTHGVLTLEESVHIVQHLRKFPHLKCLALTGLHQSCISPYMAKQMGFERCDMSANVKLRGVVLGFTPVTPEAQRDRILNKAKKYRTLDLSFLPDLSLMINLTQDDLKEIDFVLLAGLSLVKNTMEFLNGWVEMNPNLLFVCGALSHHQAETILLNIYNAKHRWKFLTHGFLNISPVYSPHFFQTIQNSAENPLPMDQSEDNFEGILRKRLFIALNQDPVSEDEALNLAKNDIHKLINKISIYTEEEISTENFLSFMNNAGVSGELLEALTDFVRVNSFECFTEKVLLGSSDCSNYHCFDQSAQSLQTALKLKAQGVITEDEWWQIEERFPAACMRSTNS
jgi:SAM-dependent methyltransferase